MSEDRDPRDISRIPTGGTIRKIVHGSAKEGLTYQVGSNYGNKVICEIIRDENSAMVMGVLEYYVYVTHEEQRKLWKILPGKDISTEFDLSV